MRGRVVIGLVVALFVVAALAIGAHEVYAAKEEGAAETLVEREAPAFQAQAYQAGEFKQVSLKGLKGKWVILFFYPQAFSYVCPTEIAKLSERYSDITGLGAEVLALSVDSAHTIKAWHESDERLKGAAFPMLSDSSHEIGETYGVMDASGGNHLRAAFIIDPEGIVQYEQVNSEKVGRSISELVRVLQALQTGGFCPVEWQAGEATIKVPAGAPY